VIPDPFHAYVNARPDVDWNTCGTAAIATVTDFHHLDPLHLPRTTTWLDGRAYWNDGQAIDAIIGAGFGPDVIFGWGTTGGRIRDAFLSFGLSGSVGYSGAFSAGWQQLWSSLQSYLNANFPVPVMIDLGAIGGPAYGVHWAIAYRVDGAGVHLGNCPWNPSPSVDAFLSAWHCWFMPYGFNHCGVFSQGPASLNTSLTYRLRNKHSGKVLDVRGMSLNNGAVVQQWDWWGGENQKWRFARQADGSYSLTSANSGKVLDVSGASPDNGAQVVQWDWWGGKNQKWRIAPLGDGSYRLTCANGGRVLDVSGGSLDIGAPVIQWDWWDGDNQCWFLDAV
jgi:Ricin-type beta-trefoil lectin domain-like